VVRVALPRVYGFVHARTGGDGTLAEDVTAQAFLEAIRARHGFDDRSDAVTWICSIARDRLIDHYRGAERDRARHLRLIVTDLNARERSAWERLDDRDAVLSVLATLPPIERTRTDPPLPRRLHGPRDREAHRSQRGGHGVAPDPRARSRPRGLSRRHRMSDERLHCWLEAAEQPLAPEPTFAAALRDELRREVGLIPSDSPPVVPVELGRTHPQPAHPRGASY
jgi:hypothetical protein